MRGIEPHFRSRTRCHGLMAPDHQRDCFRDHERLQWRDARAEYGPSKTIYNRFIR
ncbi:hypothetical protein M9978_07495 [Sphingomonas sp. MG17]|uniref:Transposase n=1 Tax=Sphingomonas tagetis TaxID=2949092 RepID=A0A9X2KLC0_9SPHN|nr:hypothetical protein [Sphingomonas tagetis]MCP3730271.1 hypothetical protein [Sphingomonas tagetis]